MLMRVAVVQATVRPSASGCRTSTWRAATSSTTRPSPAAPPSSERSALTTHAHFRRRLPPRDLKLSYSSPHDLPQGRGASSIIRYYARCRHDPNPSSRQDGYADTYLGVFENHTAINGAVMEFHNVTTKLNSTLFRYNTASSYAGALRLENSEVRHALPTHIRSVMKGGSCLEKRRRRGYPYCEK
jgi:hypothetical protein